MRPHLEYGNIIFHQPPENKEFSFVTHLKPHMQKLECLHYNAAFRGGGGGGGTNFMEHIPVLRTTSFLR